MTHRSLNGACVMAVGFKPMPPEQQPDDTVPWTMAKDTRRLTAIVQKIDAFDALEATRSRKAVGGPIG